MREASPDKYAKALTIRVSEQEHQCLKMLAVREVKTIKAIIFEALEKSFPEWRNICPNLDRCKK